MIEFVIWAWYNTAEGKRIMCVIPVLPVGFKPAKIELNKINKKDLPNYSSLLQLAKQKFCDILIEKNCNDACPNYNVFRILARRRVFNQKYVFGDDTITLPKDASIEEVSQKVMEASKHAIDIAKTKAKEISQSFIL